MTNEKLIQLLYNEIEDLKREKLELINKAEKLRKEHLETTRRLNELIEWKERTKGGRKPKINPETREEIRRRYETEYITYQELAEEYGVTKSAICRIIKEKHKNQ